MVCFSAETEDIPLLPWKDGSVVGIDVGLESFATLSNGEKIANPRFFRNEEQALAKAQRPLSMSPIISLERKAAYAGSKVVLVDPRQTSKCSRYGLIMDRDLNAAISILRLGL